MLKHNAFFFAAALAASAFAFVACGEDSASTNNGNTFTPGGPTDGGPITNPTGDGGGPTGDGGTCTNKPAGCFCGTPTTQKDFLNRCTTSAALPVNLTVKPATTADIP